MAALNPPPIVVELVIGYAPEPWLMRDSTQTTASAPSQVVGIPGYSNFCSVSSAAGIPETRSSVPVAMRRLLPEMSDLGLAFGRPAVTPNGLAGTPMLFDILFPGL